MKYQQHEILKNFLSGVLQDADKREALWPEKADSSLLLVACNPHQYSATAIAKAVEDCDVQLVGLSVTGMRDADGRPVVAVVADVASPDAVERSLERYGYEVIFSRGASGSRPADHYMQRYGELMHYLQM